LLTKRQLTFSLEQLGFQALDLGFEFLVYPLEEAHLLEEGLHLKFLFVEEFHIGRP